MIEDAGIKYNSLLVEIEIILENIKSFGVDITEFKTQFEEIKTETNEKIEKVNKEHSKKEEVKMFFEQEYGIAIRKIIGFKNSLEKYKIYFQTMSECKYVDSILESNIDKEKLNQIIEELIACLKTIRTSKVIFYKEEEQVVKNLYQTVYKLIKLEMKLNGTTKLIEYCQPYEIDSAFLSKLILEDIERLKQQGYDVKDINTVVNKLNSKNNDFYYLDIFLINSIIICENKEQIQKNIESNTDDMYERFISNKSNIFNLELEIMSSKEEFERNKKEFNKVKSGKKRSISASITALCAFLSIAVLLPIGAFKLGKVCAKEKKHFTTTTKYSSLTGKVEETSGYLDDIETKEDGKRVYPNEVVEMTIYSPWKHVDSLFERMFNYDYKRNITQYNLNDMVIDDIREYLKIDFKELGRKPAKNSEYKDELTPEDKYDETLIEIIKIIQTDSDYKIVTNDYTAKVLSILFPIIGSICYILSLILLEKNTDFGVLSIIENLKDNIVCLKNNININDENVKRILKDIANLQEKIDDLLKNNNEINEQFIKMYSNEEHRKFIDQYEKSKELLKLLENFEKEQQKVRRKK